MNGSILSLGSFFQSYFKRAPLKERGSPLRSLHIRPSFPLFLDSGIPMNCFLEYMSRLVARIIPDAEKETILSAATPEALEKALGDFISGLPQIFCSDLPSPPSTFYATLLCSGDFTQGVGRYFTDAFNRWLIPGKFTTVFSAQSLKFHFEFCPHHHFFIHQIVMPLEDR